jgi:hypothetical protein
VEQIKIQIKEQGFFSSYVKIIFFIEYLQIRMNQEIQDGYHINSEMMTCVVVPSTILSIEIFMIKKIIFTYELKNPCSFIWILICSTLWYNYLFFTSTWIQNRFLMWSVLLICLVFCVVMLPVSLDCPFLIVPSVFSNVYIDIY